MITVALLALCTTLGQGQQLLQTSKPFTTFDGATSEKYVTYLKLDGTQSVSLPMKNVAMGSQLEYTIMLWFKAAEEGWGSRYQYAFEITGSMECYFTASNTLMCESAQKCEKLQVDVSNVVPNRWTHLSLVGHPTAIGSSLLLETNLDLLQQDKKSYLILQQDNQNWKACLGGCEGLYGFVGGLRDFIIVNKYVTPDSARRLKNHYLNWDANVVAYYRFTERDFLKDQFRGNFAQITYRNISSRTVQVRDYIPNDICFPYNETSLFHKFSQRGNDIAPIQVDGRWAPADLGWAYSMSLWVMVDGATCATSNANDAKNNCYLTLLQDAFMLFFSDQNQVSLYFYNYKPFYETQSGSVFVPHNQWVNIQFGVSQYSGYEMVTFDALGRAIQYTFEKKDMQQQKVATKMLYLLKNYQGFVKQLIVFTKRYSLPITPPSLSFPNPSYWMDDTCLGYYRFDSVNLQGSTSINFCKNSQHATLTAPVTWVGTYVVDLPVNSGKTFGLVTSNQKLFDGIACNDNSMVNQFSTKNAYIKAQTQKLVNTTLMNATVEFWFKMTQNINSTNYLFTLWGQNSTKEFMTIFYDSTGILICAPFGWDSVQSPFVNYQAYTYQNITKYGWMHIACQYEQQNEQIATGYLHRQSMEEKYQTNLTKVQYLPADLYEIYLGNNRNFTRGTLGLQIREMRLWGYKRTLEEIQQWRYRELDPRIYTAFQLMSYLRLDEGAFDYFNFASILTPNISATVSFKDLKHVSDNSLTICPINTYYSTDYTKCYQDPIQLLVGSVYPSQDNGTMMWNFDSTPTQILNPVFSPSVKQRWQFDDPLLKQIAYSQMNQSIMKIPAQAFRDESQYKVRLNYSNSDITFNQLKDLTFVPNKCFYFGVNGTQNATFYKNYTQSQSTEDINFPLSLIQAQPFCHNISFYNKLIPNITYQFSPQIEKQPQLTITFDETTQTFTVLIPQREQFKIPPQVDFKIIFDFKWTSLEYGAMMNTSTLTFSNSIYTIFFNTFGQTVLPSLTVNKPIVLKGEDVAFDASETYVLYAAEADKKKNLTYSWTCPTGFEALCSTNSQTVLTVTGTNFTAMNGTYNTSLQFTVKISWTRDNGNGVPITSVYTASQSAIWQNVPTPAFTLYQPAVVKSTADAQKFTIFLNNYEIVNLTLLNIQWSIQPNLTVTSLNLTQNNTVLTVPKSGFAELTSYTLTVTITNNQYAFAQRQQQITFTTQRAPYGGSATISPMLGNARDTNFTITLSNWQSTNKPVKYRVWSTSDALGKVLLTLMTTDWLLDSQFFTFKSLNTNPFQVEITDQSGETLLVKVAATITDRAPVSMQSLIMNIGSTTAVSDKYQQMSQLVDYINANGIYNNTGNTNNETTASSTTENINPQQLVTSRGIVIQQITKDISQIRNQKSIESGESQVIIQNSVQMISQISSEPQFVDDYIAQSSLLIIQQVQACTEVTDRLILADDIFKNNLAVAISNLMKYSQQQLKQVNSGRLLFNTTTMEGITELNDKVRTLKNTYADKLCSLINPDSIQQDIRTEAFNLVVEKFSSISQVEIRSFHYADDDQSRVTLRVQDMIHYLQTLNQNLDSVCTHTTFYKVNMKPVTASQHIVQYSQMQMEFEVAQYPSINPKQFINMIYKIDPQSFRNNQTICYGYQGTSQVWTENICQTTVDEDELELECQCNMIDTEYYGVFTDTTRVIGKQLRQQREQVKVPNDSSTQIHTTYTSSSTSSVAFIGILLALAIFALIIPAIVIVLDKRDYRLASKQVLTEQQSMLLQRISKLSNEPLGYWFYKHEDVMNYQIHSKSLISHAFTQLHPLISLFAFYDISQSRLTRFITYFLQISVFAVMCVVVFGPHYRDHDINRIENGLEQRDIDLIMILGVVGIIGLLPIPFLQGCLRSKLESRSKIKITGHIGGDRLHQTERREETHEHNPTHNSPAQIIQTHHRVSSSNPMSIPPEQLDQNYQMPNEFHLEARYKPIQIVLAVIAYLACGAAFALVILYSSQVPISNQYCMVTAFYIGVFGSIFISNTLRVILNALLAESGLTNKCLRFFISHQALRLTQELSWIRQAEFELSTKEVEYLKSPIKDPLQQHSLDCNSKDCVFGDTVTNPNRQHTDSEDMCIFNGQIPNKHNDDNVANMTDSPFKKGSRLMGTQMIADFHSRKNPLRGQSLRQSAQSVTEPVRSRYSSVQSPEAINESKIE